MNQTYPVATAPHIAGALTIPVAMRDVLLALVPITVASVAIYGAPAATNLALCLAACVALQQLVGALKQAPARMDGSALVTGTLLALCLPPSAPWWMPVLGSVLAIVVAKELVGGLGWNYFNPALFGRAMLILLGAPLSRLGTQAMTAVAGMDAVTSATPMALAQAGVQVPGYGALLLGYRGGSLAETSALAVLIGGLYLVWRGHVPARIPGVMLGTVAALALVTGRDPVFHVLAGGLMIGAFFMATDWVTRPVTPKGMLLFAAGAGFLVAVFRFWMPPPEGVAFAVLIMNPMARWLERVTPPQW
ncbi:MAG: RnfABCDGE type electron transport complex subunit D [Bacillota bacterium]